MHTIIIPIVKDSKGDVTSKDNNRPIAITTIFSKLFEIILLSMYKQNLSTTDNQFGFKSEHGADMCVFALKSVIDHYRCNSSPVFICYLDASKAFDRLNFWTLFEKFLLRNVPSCCYCVVINILVFYSAVFYQVGIMSKPAI